MCWVVTDPNRTRIMPGGNPVDEPGLGEPLSVLVDRGETGTVEYKSSVRYGYEEGGYNKYVKHAIVKTVAGFLNADGGTLLIGVDDDGEILGLEKDISTLRGDPGLPDYEEHLRTLLGRNLDPPSEGLVEVTFPRVGDHTICRVDVEPSPRPVIAHHMGRDKFFVRHGDATWKLKDDDMFRYVKERWGRWVIPEGVWDGASGGG